MLAGLAKAAGFKYMVFTTEHCDGFANFNTKTTSYNIMNTPFGRDTFLMLSKAFRAQGIKVGAYLCPSLWNNDRYWYPNALSALAEGCYPTYEPASRRQVWNSYLEYLDTQLTELLTQVQR